MKKNIKHDMRKRARILTGMLNLLRDDVDQVMLDSNEFDIICLEESLRDIRTTLQMFVDNVAEMEYMLYLLKNKNP